MIENTVDLALVILVVVGTLALSYGLAAWAVGPKQGDEPEKEENPFDMQVQEAKERYTRDGMVSLRVVRDKLTPILLSAIPTAYRTGRDEIRVDVLELDETRSGTQPYIQVTEHDRDAVSKHQYDDSFYKQIIAPEFRKHVDQAEFYQGMPGRRMYYTLVITLK